MISNKKNNSSFAKNILAVVLFIQSLTFLAQPDTIYADENGKLISKQVFFQKGNSKIYHGLSFVTDTIVLQKLRFNYYFGKLDGNTKNRFFQLLSKRHQIDTSKTLIIHYEDTLKSIDEFPKRTKVVYRGSLNNIVELSRGNNKTSISNLKKIRSHKHFLNHKSYINGYRKCVKNHRNLTKLL